MTNQSYATFTTHLNKRKEFYYGTEEKVRELFHNDLETSKGSVLGASCMYIHNTLEDLEKVVSEEMNTIWGEDASRNYYINADTLEVKEVLQ